VGGGGDRGAFTGEFGMAVVDGGQRGGDVAVVDGGEDRAGAAPTVASRESAGGAKTVGVVVGEDPVVVGGALGGWQESRGQVVAYLLLGDPGQPGQLCQTPPLVAHVVSLFESSGDELQRKPSASLLEATKDPAEVYSSEFNERIEGMDASEMKRYICETFDGVSAVDSSGDTFFLYDPGGDLPAQRQFPFVTIVTGDHYDSVSRLNRPATYRLNIGLTKATYAASFGTAPMQRSTDDVLDTGYDYAAVDTIMPHPIYASQHWVCVVNPGEATLVTVRMLLAEAHRFAARRYANHQARREHRSEAVS
jgi:hypothetical protein